MKIYHEAPVSIFNKVQSVTDGDYFLVHMFEENEAYWLKAVESVKSNRHVVLDNSVFELGEAFDAERFAHWIHKLRPNEYIIPDALEDSAGTIAKAIDWMTRFSDVPGKKIGVVQGKTYEELVECYRVLNDELDIDKLAISFDYSLYHNICPHPNKWAAFALGRANIISRLLNDGVINRCKPHHLLGCSLPIEFAFYRDFDWIESIDTSNPVVAGLHNKRYSSYGLLDKHSIKVVELIHVEPTHDQLDCIMHNIQMFRQYCNGDR